MRSVLILLAILYLGKVSGQSRLDSLKTKSVDYLFEKYENSNELHKKEIYIDAIIENSRRKGDTRYLRTGYYLKSYIYEDDRVLKYSDSVIQLTKDNPDKYYPAASYINKGIHYYNIRAFQKALDNIIIAQNYAKDYYNPSFLFKTNYHIGILKTRMGEYEEALELLRENYQYSKENPVPNADELEAIFSIAILYNELKILDSAAYYNRLGSAKSKEYLNEIKINHFKLNQGITDFYLEKHTKALDSIGQVIPKLIEFDDKPNLAVAYFYMSLIYEKTGDTEQMIASLENVDKVFTENNDVLPKIRKAYEMLINYYKKNNELELQLKYIKQLMGLDSILHSNEIYINKNIIKEYDIPQLISEKENIISKLKDEKNQSKLGLGILGGFTLLLGGVLYYYAQKQKSYKRRFAEVFNDNSDRAKERVGTSQGIKGISPEVIVEIRDGLAEFENKKGFLDSTITLGSLSKKLDTNSNYLSKVINFHKQKNFSNYINDLRIEYAIKQLKINSQLRLYSIKGIAQEVGFNSGESFSKAFHKYAGIYPSFFLKQLKKVSS
ncbi:helix-turn-helix domain-containing protein [Leptobacterium flavescens]|uniref:Helix-turn-helix domain-containing protein n=1 Tax=Leptobacterium flavescens TaxID=472055 RepID=A0A6P0UIU3_9FLAO|nr:helix-turn-helix domain-containing protein [Leptobacterium flavescens]NER11828.1 helix-turn-helix domain-containing protein [Leptobacterium flavescens]